MAKKLKKDNNSTINKIYLWILAGITCLFLAGLVFAVLDIVLPNDFSRIDNISASDLEKKQVGSKTTEFYVLIYKENDAENELIASQIASYDTYVDMTKMDADDTNDGLPIYKIEFNEKNKSVVSSIVTDADCPCLVKISSGTVADTKSTVSTILEELQKLQK